MTTPSSSLETAPDRSRFRHAPESMLLHLASHLADGGCVDRLYELLLGGPAWLEAKLDRFASSTSYLSDIEIALATIPSSPNAQQALYLAQFHVARHVAESAAALHTDIDLHTLALLGLRGPALAYADAREDAESRFRGLYAVFRARLDSGHVDRMLLLGARDVAGMLKDRFKRARCHLELATALHEIGEEEQANALAGEVFEAMQATPDATIVDTRTNSGLVLLGIQGRPIATQHRTPRADEELIHHEIQGRLVEARLRWNQFDEAKRLIATIGSRALQARLWAACALALGAAGDRSGVEVIATARCIANEIADPAGRAYARCSLLSVEREPDELLRAIHDDLTAVVERAREAIQQGSGVGIGRSAQLDLLNGVIDVENLCKVADALRQAGAGADAVSTLSMAEELARMFPDPEPAVLGETPVLYIEQFVGEHRVASTAYLGTQDEALRAVSVALGSAGEWRRARAAVAQIQSELVAAEARYRLALLYSESGRPGQALRLISRATVFPLYETERGLRFSIVTRFNAEVYRESQYDTYTHVVEAALSAVLTTGRWADARRLISRAVKGCRPPASSHADLEERARARRNELRALSCSLLANARARRGDPHKARGLLVRAHRFATSVGSRQEAVTMLRMTEVFAMHGSLDSAEAIAAYVGSAAAELDAQAILINAQTVRGGAELLEDARRRLLGPVRELIDAEPNPGLRATGFCIVAKALARLGSAEEARAHLAEAVTESDKIEIPELKADTLRRLAEAALEAEFPGIIDDVYDAAIRAALQSFPRWNSIRVFALLGESLHAAGRTDRAEEVFQHAVAELGLRYPRSHSADAMGLISALARTQRFDLAVSLASTLCDDLRYHELMLQAITMLVAELARAGRYEDASLLLLRLTDPYHAGEALCAIARSARDAGSEARAAIADGLAERLVGKIADAQRRERLMAMVAGNWAAAGRVQNALALLDAVSTAAVRSQGRDLVAEAEMRRGHVKSALRLWGDPTMDHLLARLARSAATFAKIDPTLPAEVLTQALRIAGWYDERWHRAHLDASLGRRQ